MDYKEAYEKEHLKNAELAGRVADLEMQKEDLSYKLDRIKNNPLFKASKPARNVMHWVIRQKNRLAGCGGPKGVVRKLKQKKQEKSVMKSYGTDSFPTPEEAKKERETIFERPVKVSILVPLYNTPKEFLTAMIDSVLAQTYENWELCLADGSDEAHKEVGEICASYVEKEGDKKRIRYEKLAENKGISGNTNACYAMSTGEYIGLFDHDDILHPSALYEYVKAINEQGADYIYCDETTFKNGDINKMLTMHFKPDYAPDNLRANNYICHFFVARRSVVEQVGGFRKEFDGAQDYDFIFRCTEEAREVVHVPEILYHWRTHKASTADNPASKMYAFEAGKRAIEAHLERTGVKGTVSHTPDLGFYRVKYPVQGHPLVSIIIPNKDHVTDLRRAVTSILEKSTYDNYEIIIVENNSETEEIFRYYDELKKNEKIKIVTYEGGFNYSTINNLGVSRADGDYVLLLNNDTEVITVNWMEELLMYAQREDVGAVGCKLYYADRTIQHAGVVIGLGAHRTAGHSHYRMPRQNLGYMGRLCYAQDVSAVTGACLLVKKSLYEAVEGLDEGFAVSLNDVDFCLKLRERGLLNVFTPFAELYHYESVSRGLDTDGEKACLLYTSPSPRDTR